MHLKYYILEKLYKCVRCKKKIKVKQNGVLYCSVAGVMRAVACPSCGPGPWGRDWGRAGPGQGAGGAAPLRRRWGRGYEKEVRKGQEKEVRQGAGGAALVRRRWGGGSRAHVKLQRKMVMGIMKRYCFMINQIWSMKIKHNLREKWV